MVHLEDGQNLGQSQGEGERGSLEGRLGLMSYGGSFIPVGALERF